MVVDSFKVFVDKYPFFFDRNVGSNFYRVCKVNNSHFQRLYNDLFKVYESCHIRKNVLIWKVQDSPYNYDINFVANYNNIKDVTIYKNDYPIYFKEYLKSDEKNEFIYTYQCRYLINNTNELKVYQCTNCGTLYLSNNLTEHCIECNNHTYRRLDIYKCTECDEIYFSDETLTDCTKNNHPNSLEQVQVYECDNCKEIYFTNEIPEQCYSCNNQLANTNVNNVNGLNYNNDNIIIEDNRNIINTNPINDISGSYKKYHFHITDYNQPITIKIYNENILIEILTLNEENNWETYSRELPSNLEYIIEYTPNITGLQYNPEEVYTYNDIMNDNQEDDNIDVDIPIPIIPDDKFVIEINTYNEYHIIKGFPENDTLYIDEKGNYIPTIFDHDRSLDELGALNNIPRKEYNIVTDEVLYPYTEPPYNDRATEDDYHYMNRILEYNLRLWAIDEKYHPNGMSGTDFIEQYNPVTLELWKLYGINSRLVNREKYLLKVFDENNHPFDEDTGLVKCWTPLPWEHKDRFCDASQEMKSYFFVIPENTNPIVNESVVVHFKLMNSLGERINKNFYVNIYKMDDDEPTLIYTKNDGKFYEDSIRLTSNWFNIPDSDEFNIEDYYNIFRFYCFDLNDNPINTDENGNHIPVDIMIMLRDYYTSDIHVDNMAYLDYDMSPDDYSSNLAKGTLKYPFLTLQEAINNTNANNNIIGVNLRDLDYSKYVIEDNSLLISNDTKIVGNIKSENGVNYVPRIVNRCSDKSFFKVLGGKNIDLSLSNLCLIRGGLKSFINFSTWNNDNVSLLNYENVLIHGGVVDIVTDFDDSSSYYPFDFIHIQVSLKNKYGAGLPSNMVRVYNEEEILTEGITDNNGDINNLIVPINLINNPYNFIMNIGNLSDTFFQATLSYEVNIHSYSDYSIVGKSDKNIYAGDTVKLIPNETYNGNVNLFCKDRGLWQENININNYNWSNFPTGKYLVYTTNDNTVNGTVKDEWLLESKYLLSNFINHLQGLPRWNGFIIKNLTLSDNGLLEYDTVNITSNSSINDFKDAVLDIKLSENNEKLEVELFNPVSTDENITYDDTQLLKKLIYNISFNNNGILEIDRVEDL